MTSHRDDLSQEDIEEIFDRITEVYDDPIAIGSRCQSNIFYRVEDLCSNDIAIIASWIAQRIRNVCHPIQPDLLVSLAGSNTELPFHLAIQLAPPNEELEVIPYQKVFAGNGIRSKMKNSNIVLVNDVITTARSCLEAHSRTVLMGSTVLCWAALVDRTFGPGPVPVVAALGGRPVTLL